MARPKKFLVKLRNPASTNDSTANLTAMHQYLSQSNGHEKHINRKLNLHNRLLSTIKRELPDLLARQCSACVVNQRKLILYTNAPVWASRLRYHEASILKGATKGNQIDIDRVDIRILIAHPIIYRPATQGNLPSTETIRLLAGLAQSMEYAPLQQSLLRLAEAIKKRQ